LGYGSSTSWQASKIAFGNLPILISFEVLCPSIFQRADFTLLWDTMPMLKLAASRTEILDIPPRDIDQNGG
jgi:hypothetical protein